MRYLDGYLLADLYFGVIEPDEILEELSKIQRVRQMYDTGEEFPPEHPLQIAINSGQVRLDELPKLVSDALAEVVPPSDEELQRYFDNSVASANKDYVGYMLMVSDPPLVEWVKCNWELNVPYIHFSRRFVEWCYVAGQNELKKHMCHSGDYFVPGKGFDVPPVLADEGKPCRSR